MFVDEITPPAKARLVSWNEGRGFGILQGDQSFKDRYYLHICEIDAPPLTQIRVGMWFEFKVFPPNRQGQFRRAVNAKLIDAPSSEGSIQ